MRLFLAMDDKDNPCAFDDSSGADFLMNLQRRVAERYQVSPVDTLMYKADFSHNGQIVRATPRTFSVGIRIDGPEDRWNAEKCSVLCDAVWGSIKDSFREGCTVIWRVRPYIDVRKSTVATDDLKVDGLPAHEPEEQENHYLVIYCRIGSPDGDLNSGLNKPEFHPIPIL